MTQFQGRISAAKKLLVHAIFTRTEEVQGLQSINCVSPVWLGFCFDSLNRHIANFLWPPWRQAVCPPAQAQQKTLARAGKIRCVLAHDHVLIRQGLRRLLEDEPDLEVVSEVSNVAEAVQITAEEQPEIVIADINTLGLPPDEAEELLLRASPLSRVVFLSAHEDSGVRNLRAGGSACAVDGTSAQELVKMVRMACRHHQAEVRDASGTTREEWGAAEGLPSRKRGLTAREQEVLKLLAEGSTVRSAARALGLSMKTVDAHKFNLMRKLGVHNKAELVMWAIRKQVVKIPANS